MVTIGIRCWRFAARLPHSPTNLGPPIEAGQRIVDAYDSPDSLTDHLPHRPFLREAGGKDRYGR